MSYKSKAAQVIYGNNDFFMSISLTSWLKERAKTSTDVIGATLLVKSNPSDLDSAALMSKTLDAGITKSGDDYLVETESADFGTDKLMKDTTYGMYFGVKFTGDTSFREIILKVPSLRVLSDGIRE